MEQTQINPIEDPALSSYKRRELTPLEQKVADEKEYIFSLTDWQKHNFVILRKEPNTLSKTKTQRQVGKGGYVPKAPTLEVLYLYDTHCSMEQIIKKERKGDIIVDFNFTDRAKDDAKKDQRINDVILYVQNRESTFDNLEKIVGIRAKMAEFKKSGKSVEIKPDEKTVKQLYAKAQQ